MVESQEMRRRDFLFTGALPFATAGAAPQTADVSCILLMLVGGPSHVDTWDLKPDAPREHRSPFRPIPTNVPGIGISEIFPRLARHADKFSLVRSVSNERAAPFHDAGYQAMQTGRLFRDGIEHPHYGCVVSNILGSRRGAPVHVMLPGPIGATGGNMPHGHTAGYLGHRHDPVMRPPEAFQVDRQSESMRGRYGWNTFGQSCLAARLLVEQGVRFVTVNMFDTVFEKVTWDAHGYQPFCSLNCYRDVVGPMFDHAFSALLEDLSDRGLLKNTMVVALSEFGRTPRLNYAGGRDHWTGCWTVLMGGGPLRCGIVVGESDEIGAYPKDRPVTPADIAATIYRGFGIDPRVKLDAGDGHRIPLVDPEAKPIHELLIAS